MSGCMVFVIGPWTANKSQSVMQGAENFRKEFKQLRRSFRFNEYKEIREQNPPTNPVARVSLHISLTIFLGLGGLCLLLHAYSITRALRRFPPFNENCTIAQVMSSANKQIVRGLATLDVKLEDIGVLPPIKQAPLPEEITDDDGNLATDCADVRLLPPVTILSLPHCWRHTFMSLAYRLLRFFLMAFPDFIEHQPSPSMLLEGHAVVLLCMLMSMQGMFLLLTQV